MDFSCPSQGDLSKNRFQEVVAFIFKEKINCSLKINYNNHTKTIYFRNDEIFFAESSNREENFGNFLIKKGIITKDQFDLASVYMKDNGIRFGRSLVKIKVFTYENLFHWVEEHLRWIALSCFEIDKGKYLIDSLDLKKMENIGLNLDVLRFIVTGFRYLNDYSYIRELIEKVDDIYLINPELISLMDLKKFEFHIFDLLKTNNRVSDILEKSELSSDDTYKILYMFFLTGVISEKKTGIGKDIKNTLNIVSSPRFFSSYNEALKYYNSKYEMIFKMLSKEIGPIAISILSGAIESISEKLPSYLKDITIKATGKLNEDQILKKVWYNDFEENLPFFLKGLEEILYAEIFAVKKNLGVDYEKQILKWINIAQNKS